MTIALPRLISMIIALPLVPVWSAFHVAGVNLKTLNPEIGSVGDNENWKACHQKVVNAANEMVKVRPHLETNSTGKLVTRKLSTLPVRWAR